MYALTNGRIYTGSEILDNHALVVETLETMQAANQRSGCTSFLPTLITSTDDFMRRAVEVMRAYLAQHQHQALGLHLEGPYLSPAPKKAPMIRR